MHESINGLNLKMRYYSINIIHADDCKNYNINGLLEYLPMTRWEKRRWEILIVKISYYLSVATMCWRKRMFTRESEYYTYIWSGFFYLFFVNI